MVPRSHTFNHIIVFRPIRLTNDPGKIDLIISFSLVSLMNAKNMRVFVNAKIRGFGKRELIFLLSFPCNYLVVQTG